ncbi:phosphatidate cytidylyltransferase [Ideonella alba]|uniref:Phosphatidate cytidylyltransferase n=1 Tax=Ideonella alba TaxID=2824118 RepID=A0A941BBH8_9BURK|nr:phosphatidate cytidylyltransferase [Ideonella alba]MBQ0930885.1 phosphatidate cytidylyltransferase [Ideonella alba]
MLLQRVITALVLLALLLPALLAPVAWPFALLTLVLIGAGGWEWGRLNGLAFAPSLGLGALVAALCGLAWSQGMVQQVPPAVWWLATACWVLGGSLALAKGPTAWPQLSQGLRLVIGVVVLCAAWLALSAGRARGLEFLLSVFCVVWMADIAAYFGGRRFGRRKLAPAISPGKSWEGVWSGMTGVALLAALWLALSPARAGVAPSIFETIQQRLGWPGLALGIVFLCALSVMGDLIESLAKRAVGAKDSSRLLPGHGGVLDRVDALLPTLPAAMALASLAP